MSHLICSTIVRHCAALYCSPLPSVVFCLLYKQVDGETYKQTLQDLHMLTPLLFWTLSHHLLEREGGETKMAGRVQRSRDGDAHMHIMICRQKERQTELED